AAEKELARLGPTAELPLRKAAAENKSPERSPRLADLLRQTDEWARSGDRVRAVRAMHVLERVGTPAAREALAGLAKGAAGAGLTRDAAGALERLDLTTRK